MDSLLAKEFTTLQSERKMGETEIKSSQSQISNKLRGAMGRDMIDVLDGRKKVKISKIRKLKHFILSKYILIIVLYVYCKSICSIFWN